MKIKPFPRIGSADHLMKSEQYLRSEAFKIQDKWDEVHNNSIPLGQAFSEYLNPEPSEEGVYPIQKNIRQIYAYKVLESFYEFKLKNELKKYNRKAEELRLALDEQLEKVDETYEAKLEEARKAAEDAANRMMAELFSLQESKQILEEFWLKSGGLVKYISDEDVVHYLNARRETLV